MKTILKWRKKECMWWISSTVQQQRNLFWNTAPLVTPLSPHYHKHLQILAIGFWVIFRAHWHKTSTTKINMSPQTLDEQKMKSFTSTLATTLMILLFPNNPPPPFKNIQIFGHPPRYFIVFFWFGFIDTLLCPPPLFDDRRKDIESCAP